MKDLKVALINCPAWDIEFPPYNIALLAAVLKREGFGATVFDLNRDLYRILSHESSSWLLPDPYAFWQSEDHVRRLLARNHEWIDQLIAGWSSYEVLGFTLQSLNYVFTLELVRKIREKFPAKIMIAGGPECFRNFNSEYMMRQSVFDALCLGEGEEALPELLGKIREGQPWNTRGFLIKSGSGSVDCGDRDPMPDLGKVPYADYGFLDAKTEKIAISTSRGCVNNCTFCLEKAHSRRFRYRKADSIIHEIMTHQKDFPCLRYVYFNDSLMNGNTDEFERFCRGMIKAQMNVRWGGHIVVRKEMTREFLHTMKKAGAERLNFGVESGSDVVLKSMKKSFSSDLALRVLTDAKEAGLSFSVNLIVGYPGETEAEFEKTVHLAGKLRKLTDCVHVNPCLVLKNSDLYLHHDQWGIVLPEDFVTGWFLRDGTNTPPIREKRRTILKEALEARS